MWTGEEGDPVTTDKAKFLTRGSWLLCARTHAARTAHGRQRAVYSMERVYMMVTLDTC